MHFEVLAASRGNARIRMHLRLACYRVSSCCTRRVTVGSEFDAAAAAEFAAEAAFEVHEAAEAEKSFGVLLAVEGAEHAGEIIGGGDLGAKAVAERFALGVSAEVVVA